MRLGGICQRDSARFIKLLGGVERGRTSSTILRRLGGHCLPKFHPERRRKCVQLAARGCRTRRCGSQRLLSLSKETFDFRTGIRNAFPRSTCPTSRVLAIGRKTRVVFVGGSSSNRRQCCGKVVNLVATIDGSNVQIGKGKRSRSFLLRARR